MTDREAIDRPEGSDLTALVASVLSREFGIEAATVDYQQGGQDDGATVFRVWADGSSESGKHPTHIVKVDHGRPGGLVAPDLTNFLQSRGVPLVVAPLPSSAGSTSVSVGPLTFAIFPFIHGTRGHDVGLSDRQWSELGRFVRQLHDTELPADLAQRLPRETFEPKGVERMPQLGREVDRLTSRSAAVELVASTWRANRARIDGLVARAGVLAEATKSKALRFVTCHADLHTYNVLVRPDGGLHVIDWDEVVLAPRERDLMFFLGGISEEWMPDRGTTRFLEGYREVAIDPEAIAYYRHAWAIQDINGYTWRVLHGGRDDADRSTAARILAGLFRPGEIVDLAERAYGPGRGIERFLTPNP